MKSIKYRKSGKKYSRKVRKSRNKRRSGGMLQTIASSKTTMEMLSEAAKHKLHDTIVDYNLDAKWLYNEIVKINKLLFLLDPSVTGYIELVNEYKRERNEYKRERNEYKRLLLNKSCTELKSLLNIIIDND